MLNLILFGPPGSGKGTQAAKLVRRYQLVHISTGDLFRYELSNNTPLGIEARSYMDKGQLVPDSVTIGMLKNKVESHPKARGFIFDGFPRTIPQAQALDELLQSKHQSISGLIALTVEEDEIVKRILLRGKESGRADDQNERIVRHRIHEYNEKTAPVFDYYAQKNKSYQVDGMGSILAIFRRLCKTIRTFHTG